MYLYIILSLLGVAFFVLCEYSIAKTKSYQFPENTNIHKKIRYVIDNKDTYLSICQIGITAISLYLGGVGEEYIEEIIKLNYSNYISTSYSHYITIGLLTYLEVVFAESIPKSIALRSNKIIPYIIYPLNTLYYITIPFLYIININSNFFLKILRLPTNIHSEHLSQDEIEHIVEHSIQDEDTKDILVNTLNFYDYEAKDILTPRTDIVALDINSTQEEILEVIKNKYSRIPIYHESIDNIRGVLIVKEILNDLIDKKEIKLARLMKRAYIIPENKSIKELFSEMNKNRNHISFAYDEHGGLAGIITLEDIIEKIIGFINDEKDNDMLDIKINEDNSYEFDSNIEIEEILDYLPNIPESSEYTTLSGLCNFIFKNIPREGEVKEFMGYEFSILEANRIKCLKVKIRLLV